MKKYSIILLTIALAIISCKKDPKTEVPPALTNTDLNETETVEEVTFNNPKNTLLYNNYLAIKAAMVNTNATKTEDAAKKMIADFKNDSIYETVKQVASLITATDDIKKQREFFVGLTDATTTILKADIKTGKIHQQFCPMAFDGKGAYWLSNSKEIRNPYFGNIMLACGEVTKVLQ